MKKGRGSDASLRVVGYFEVLSDLIVWMYKIKQQINAKRIGAASRKSRFILYIGNRWYEVYEGIGNGGGGKR